MGFKYPKHIKDQLIGRMLAGEDPKQVAASVGNEPSISTLKNWLQEYKSSQWEKITQIYGTDTPVQYNKQNGIDNPSQQPPPSTNHSSSDHIIKRSNDNIENWLDDLLGDDNTCLPLDKRYCCRCGTVIPSNREICPQCGVNQKACEEHRGIWQRQGFEYKYCYRCGRKIDPLAAECTCCHTHQHTTPASQNSFNWKGLNSVKSDYTPARNNRSNINSHAKSNYQFLKYLVVLLFGSALMIGSLVVSSGNKMRVSQSPSSITSTANNNDHTTDRLPSNSSDSLTKQVPNPVITNKKANSWKADNENRCRVQSGGRAAMTVTGASASSLAVEISMKTDIAMGKRATVRFDSEAPMQVDYSVPLDGMVKLSVDSAFVRKMRKSKKISITFVKQDNSKRKLEFSLKNFVKACPWTI